MTHMASRSPNAEVEALDEEQKIPTVDISGGGDGDYQGRDCVVKQEAYCDCDNDKTLTSGAVEGLAIDMEYMLHLEEVNKLQMLRVQLEPDLKILRDKLPKMRTVRSFQVTHIDSPHDFYVKFIDVEFPVELLEHRMQDYYNNPLSLVDVKFDPVFDVKLYVWLYEPPEGDCRWERVRVYARNKAERVCRVFLIDVGIQAVVFYEELYELDEDFKKSEARAIRVYLLDIIPPNGETTWSEDSIRVFKELAFNKNFHGVGFNQFSEKEDSLFMEHCARYGVILFDKHSKHTLNAELCRAGMAEGIGLASGRPELLEPFRDDDGKRSCEFDVLKLAAILCDKKAAIEIGLEGPPETAAQIHKHISYEFEREGKTKSGIRMAREIKERVARCICGTFLNLSSFYVMLYEQLPLLEKMVDYIETIWEHIDIVDDPSAIKPGTLLLVVRTDDPTQRVHRAVAREAPKLLKDGKTATGNAALIKIFLIDVGRSLTAKVGALRLLPKNLCKIPPFAHRVHLDPKNLKLNTATWCSTASNMCRTICTKPVPAGLFYIWRQPQAVTLELDDFDDEVVFDIANTKWVVQSRALRSGASSDALIKANPFFTQLFKSVGIEVSLESAEPPTNRFLSLKQVRLAELVKTTGFAVDMNL